MKMKITLTKEIIAFSDVFLGKSDLHLHVVVSFDDITLILSESR